MTALIREIPSLTLSLKRSNNFDRVDIITWHFFQIGIHIGICWERNLLQNSQSISYINKRSRELLRQLMYITWFMLKVVSQLSQQPVTLVVFMYRY